MINSNRTEVKRFVKNDKSIEGVCEYIFIDTGKIIGYLGKEPPLMTTTVSVDIDLARNLQKIIISRLEKNCRSLDIKKASSATLKKCINVSR